MIDPGLQYELNVPKPWFASRLLSSMNILNIREPIIPQPLAAESNTSKIHEQLKKALGPWNWGGKYMKEDNNHLFDTDTSQASTRPFKKDSSSERRKYFTKRSIDRSKLFFSPKYIYGMEVYPFVCPSSNFSLL